MILLLQEKLVNTENFFDKCEEKIFYKTKPSIKRLVTPWLVNRRKKFFHYKEQFNYC